MGSRRVSELTFFLSESPLSSGSRESEIVELKSQLARMREDWIEEECHRVEAQLALKEARKEIKQLKQVIETMRSSLADKDKGIQKYFVDINIQNKKLESLLQSMEMAHSGLLIHNCQAIFLSGCNFTFPQVVSENSSCSASSSAHGMINPFSHSSKSLAA